MCFWGACSQQNFIRAQTNIAAAANGVACCIIPCCGIQALGCKRVLEDIIVGVRVCQIEYVMVLT